VRWLALWVVAVGGIVGGMQCGQEFCAALLWEARQSRGDLQDFLERLPPVSCLAGAACCPWVLSTDADLYFSNQTDGNWSFPPMPTSQQL